MIFCYLYAFRGNGVSKLQRSDVSSTFYVFFFLSLSRFFCFVGFLTVAYYRSVQWTFDLVLDCFDCFLAMILATDIRLAFIFIWLAKRWKITTFCVEWIWWKSSTAKQHSDMFVCSLFFNLLLSLSFVVVVVLVFYSTNEIKNYLYAILNQDHCFRMQCDALFWPFRRNSLAVVCDALFMWLCLVIRNRNTTRSTNYCKTHVCSISQRKTIPTHTTRRDSQRNYDVVTFGA